MSQKVDRFYNHHNIGKSEPIFTFFSYRLQGSAATDLRNGGRFNSNFIGRFFSNFTVNRLRKLVHCCRNCRKHKSDYTSPEMLRPRNQKDLEAKEKSRPRPRGAVAAVASENPANQLCRSYISLINSVAFSPNSRVVITAGQTPLQLPSAAARHLIIYFIRRSSVCLFVCLLAG